MNAKTPPNLAFSHMGISVTDLAKMERFYTQVMGFTVTDRGETAGLDIVFLSRDPRDHHQIVLATGRPKQMPINTRNPVFGPSINQISFRMASLADLRDMHRRLKAEGYTDDQLMIGNHGIGWSIYFPDPEGNMIEVFVDSEWYCRQPVLQPLDLTQSDAAILAATEAMCRAVGGFESAEQWRQRQAARMAAYRG
jgi:catechol 2,3-dioxygenase